MAKAATAPKKRKPRPKQGHLKGMAPPTIKEIEQKADDYCEARDERIRLLGEETNLKKELNELMKKHKLKSYEYEDRIVELVAGEPNLKVKKKKPEENGEV